MLKLRLKYTSENSRRSKEKGKAKKLQGFGRELAQLAT